MWQLTGGGVIFVVDRLYASAELAMSVASKGHHMIGTISVDRGVVPKAIRFKGKKPT